MADTPVDPAKTEFELEQRVLNEAKKPWDNADGYPRNVGNIARKIGCTTDEYLRVSNKLRKEGRLT